MAAAFLAVNDGDGLGNYGLTTEQARVSGLNAKMFNSFLDGSKPAIEASEVCNVTGLTAAPEGLLYPPAAVEDIPIMMRPREEVGQLHHKGQVEKISSLVRDGSTFPYDIRFGVWVVLEGETEYIRRCFTEYGVRTDSSGCYACLSRRWYLIGREIGISVASIGLLLEPTGCATGFHADAIATAKCTLKAGEVLNGEDGYTVVGRLITAQVSIAAGCCRPAGALERRGVRREPGRGPPQAGKWKLSSPRRCDRSVVQTTPPEIQRAGFPSEALPGKQGRATTT